MKSNYWLLQEEKGEKKFKSSTVNSFNFAATNFRNNDPYLIGVLVNLLKMNTLP
jgi:hypothetical protein